jgi:hypothetical protein
MPAPQFLAILPKPILFGLYGAIGGLLGALVFGEPAWQILQPPPPKAPAQPAPQLAISASKELQLLIDRANSFAVEIDRANFKDADGAVDVKVENLPAGITASPLTLAKSETAGKVTLQALGSVSTAIMPIKVIASATVGGKIVKAETSVGLVVTAPPVPQADVFFVLDVTGSMEWAINGIRDGVGGFAKKMRDNKIDFRLGLLAFRDVTIDAVPMDLLLFDGQPFTTDVNAFKNQVGRLVSMGGGDIPESSLEAVELACNQKYRKEATKVLLLITDAPPKVKPRQNEPQSNAEELAAVKKTAAVVRDREIDAVHLVVRPFDSKDMTNDLETYRSLMEAGLIKGGGQSFNLRDTVSRGSDGFTTLIDKFTSAVVEAAAAKNPVKPTVAAKAETPRIAVKGVQSSQEFDKESQPQLVLAIGVWTGAISSLVCLVLLAGQHHYLRGSLPAVGGSVAGVVGGFIVGIVGGAAGQSLYMLAPGNATLAAIFQVFGWSILGGLAGVGLSLFIPNLKWFYGLAGGAIGGAVGGIGYMGVSSATTDLVGRLVGGLIVGFCIGLMVAIVEAAFRRAWLEVRFGARETITVNLGPEPVKIGGDNRMCTVWARGAAPVALRYFIRGGQVVCEDTPNRAESLVKNGDSREVGNVTVTVRTGSSAAPTGAVAPRPTATPPLPRGSTPAPLPTAPKPLGLDPFEDDPLPMPMSPPVAAPRPAPIASPRSSAAAAPPAAPPKPPIPVGSAKPPAPPRPVSPTPAAKPATGPRDPDACPSCGRKNPGRPGSRYCMLCDQTY